LQFAGGSWLVGCAQLQTRYSSILTERPVHPPADLPTHWRFGYFRLSAWRVSAFPSFAVYRPALAGSLSLALDIAPRRLPRGDLLLKRVQASIGSTRQSHHHFSSLYKGKSNAASVLRNVFTMSLVTLFFQANG
jgi:hypothetical protein